MTRVLKRRSTVFVLSDFYGEIKHDVWTIAGRKHDLMGVQVYDVFARELPNVGLIKVRDAESGEDLVIDTGSKRLRTAHGKAWREQQTVLKEEFAKSGVNWVEVATNEDYVKALMKLFKRK